MGTNECSQPASKSSWDSHDFGDVSMVLKMAHFRKSTGPQWVNCFIELPSQMITTELCITNCQSLKHITGTLLKLFIHEFCENDMLVC